MIIDTVGAFCPHGRFKIQGNEGGPLTGLTFGVKDVIDIAGHTTGAGNPRWLATHPPAAQTASCVQLILDAGASMIGKTIADELAYSLSGNNYHYGTPKNVSASGRAPGGSSSGSAAAVAAHLCDFALGTDSGGSVRVPASYCGLYGIRTTHGRVPMDGVVPFMPTFDTIGWFARDPILFARIGRAIIPRDDLCRPTKQLVLATDAWAEADSGIAESLQPWVRGMAEFFGTQGETIVAPKGLESWRTIFRYASAAETWRIHGDWIKTATPRLGPGIVERFAWAATVTPDECLRAELVRSEIRERLLDLLAGEKVVALPTTPSSATRLDASENLIESIRQRTQRLTCIAGLAGLPQLSIPSGLIGGFPIGLSIIGPPGSDNYLIELSGRLPVVKVPH